MIIDRNSDRVSAELLNWPDIALVEAKQRGRVRGGRYFSNNRGSSSRDSPPYHGSHYNQGFKRGRGDSHQTNMSEKRRRLNPPDRTGSPSRCAICGSVLHYAKDCQHNEEQSEQSEDSVPTLITTDIDI